LSQNKDEHFFVKIELGLVSIPRVTLLSPTSIALHAVLRFWPISLISVAILFLLFFLKIAYKQKKRGRIFVNTTNMQKMGENREAK
jgi:predicted membrane protein